MKLNKRQQSLIIKFIFTARSAVNHKRHLHCQVPSATTYYTDSAGEQSPRPVSRMSRTSIPPRRFFKENADLTIGEKIYLWSIEKIYNLEHLKRLKQEQYQKLLELEAKKGLFIVTLVNVYVDLVVFTRIAGTL